MHTNHFKASSHWMYMSSTDRLTDEEIKKIYSFKNIAVVGMSRDPVKAAHFVPKYMIEMGYNIMPVNPSADKILGRRTYSRVSDIKSQVDIVAVFRPSEDVYPVVEDSIKKNGIKVDGKQNYQCKDCKRQFIGDHALSYLGCNSGITRKILQLMVRGSGIRDIAEVERISIGKVLRTLTESAYQIQPKQSHYESLEVDEFWTFVGNKNNKQWLIYAYHRETGEIVAYVWGKRDLATVQRLKTKLKQLGIHYTRIASDHWDSFITAFKNCKQSIGKLFTVGIEGNNCKIRHRIRRGFRRSCNFSKKLENHFKAFDLTFFYINNGFI